MRPRRLRFLFIRSIFSLVVISCCRNEIFFSHNTSVCACSIISCLSPWSKKQRYCFSGTNSAWNIIERRARWYKIYGVTEIFERHWCVRFITPGHMWYLQPSFERKLQTWLYGGNTCLANLLSVRQSGGVLSTYFVYYLILIVFLFYKLEIAQCLCKAFPVPYELYSPYTPPVNIDPEN